MENMRASATKRSSALRPSAKDGSRRKASPSGPTRKATREPDRITASVARARWSELTSEVAYGQQRVIIERHGKGVLVLLSMTDFEQLQSLEDLADLQVALKARRERGRVSEDKARRVLGLA